MHEKSSKSSTSSRALLTPRDLADAIGASESSLRRWVDSGQIRMSRTAGGHRRIPLAEAIQFIRQTGVTVVRPDILGIEDISTPAAGKGSAPLSESDRLFELLRSGQRRVVQGLMVSWFLEGRSLSAVFDGPLTSAMHRLGELWKHDERGILIEHRATQICISALTALRELLPPVQEHAPLALGGGPENDPYLLPSLMASTLLAEAGFHDVNFGPNTPVELLLNEALQRKARLVWLSISAPQESKPLSTAIKQLASGLAKNKIKLILGGRCNTELTPRGMANVTALGSMSELAAFARGILSDKGDRSDH